MRDFTNNMKQIKTTLSTSEDTLNMKFLKLIQPIMAPIYLNLINQTIINQKFPDCLKTSKVIPIIKPYKDKLDPLSYRQINLLSPVSKIIEKTIVFDTPCSNLLLLSIPLLLNQMEPTY